MFGSDTAKRDLILIVIGLLAAILFYGIYSISHPLSIADSSLGKEQAGEYSSQFLSSIGHTASDERFPEYRVIPSMLDSLQKVQNYKTIYTSNSVKESYPVFFWNVEQQVSASDWMRRLSGSNRSESVVELQLSEAGRVIGFQNPDQIIPFRTLHTDLLMNVRTSIEPYIDELQNDTTALQRFQFRIDGNQEQEIQNENTDQNYLGNQVYFGEIEAEKIARYHLEQSGWNEEKLKLTNIEESDVHRKDGAYVTFTKRSEELQRSVDVRVLVLANGALIQMEFEDPDVGEQDMTYSEIHTGIIGIGLLLFGLWVVILLFMRIRHRLVDTKLAVLMAVLAGFAFPAILMFEWSFGLMNSFDSFSFRALFIQLFQVGVSAAFISLFYFTVTAVGDSITREHWSTKLRTFDFVRMGHFFNRPIGSVVLRSLSYSFMLAAIWASLLYIIPDSYLTVDEEFRGNSTYLPYIHSLFFNFFVFLIIAQSVFLILAGKLSSYSKNALGIAVMAGVIFAVFSLIPQPIGPLHAEFAIVGAIAFLAGWGYVKEDFLTVFLTLFFFGIHLSAASGWVMANSPDTSIFAVSTLVLILAAAYGALSVKKGKSIRDLPKYIPDYIIELAQDERMKQELQIARKVQQSFLPERTPDIPGLDIAAVCTPAFETGGDYYDFIPLDDGRLAVTIGDVSGKGIEAAFYMTFTKGLLHALTNEKNSTVDILSRINTLFRRNAQKGTFISLIFGVIHIENGSFTFSRAGHNPLLYYDADQERLHEYKPQGIGLGLTGDELFRKNTTESVLDFKKDDILVLYTDGVVEATNRLDKFYGEKRLRKMIKNNKNLSSSELLQKLTADLEEFGVGADQHDDMTVLIIKKK